MENKKGFHLEWFGEKRVVRLLLLAALLALGVIHFESLFMGALFLWQVAQPLVLGCILAYMLEVVVKRLEKIYFPKARNPLLQKSRRPVCIMGATVLVLSMIVLVISMVIPGLGDAFALLAQEVPKYLEQLKGWILEHEDLFPSLAESAQGWQVDWEGIGKQIVTYAFSGLGGLLTSTVSVIGAVTGTVINFFMSVIFAFFLLAGKERLLRQFRRSVRAMLPAERAKRLGHVLSVTHKSFSGFIVGQSLCALILGVATWLGMMIFGMPYALIVGVLSGVTALVPIIGGYIGAILGAFLVFTQSPVMALWFLLFIIVLQQIQGNVIYPRLVSSSIGLPGIWVLAAVSIGGGLGGIGGMLLGVPIAAALYILSREKVANKEKEKGLSPDITSLEQPAVEAPASVQRPLEQPKRKK